MTDLPIPRQLPRDVTHFVNREAQLGLLDALLVSVSSADTAEPIFAAVAGPPGIGKTALAVHWAHRIRRHFTDGDLYIDFGGYSQRARVGTDVALDGFLRALNIQPDQIPPGIEARSALLRSALVGKRVLMLLDNVVSAADTRPFLPGSPGCMVIATSRNALAGLVARDGARRMVLDILTMEESLTLLEQIVGDSRVQQEDHSVRQLVQLCGFLPLPLRILGERIASQPDRLLSDFVLELTAERARLDKFSSSDDDEIDIRSVFSSSYRELRPDAARTFRLLSLHPGSSFSTEAASAILQEDLAATERHLDNLSAAHLVQRAEHGRYKFHDLLREYATERLKSDESPAAQNAARRRVLSWYVRSVDVACHSVLPNFRELNLDELEPAPSTVRFDGPTAAWAWFEKELANLNQALRDAIGATEFEIAWRLPVVMYPLLELHQHWHQWLELQRLGLGAAESAGSIRGAACNLLGLGDVQWLLQQRDDALSSYEQALRLARQANDSWVEGFSLRQRGVVLLEQGNTREAIPLLRDARTVFRKIGERRGEGMTLLSMANAQRGLRSFDSALSNAQEGLEVLRSISDPWSSAWAQCAVGQALLDVNQPVAALTEYESALTTFRNIDDKRNQGRALLGITISFQRMNRGADAAEFLAKTEAIIIELNDSDLTAEMREMMAQLYDQQ